MFVLIITTKYQKDEYRYSECMVPGIKIENQQLEYIGTTISVIQQEVYYEIKHPGQSRRQVAQSEGQDQGRRWEVTIDACQKNLMALNKE